MGNDLLPSEESKPRSTDREVGRVTFGVTPDCVKPYETTW
jgi:hypothetical protein